MINLYRSMEIDALFSNKSLVQKYLDVEIALAKVQADLGVIPQHAADIIASNAVLANIDLGRYEKDLSTIGFPIVGLIKQLNECIPDGNGEYLHWGATTQDIMDTGLVLVLKEAIALYEKEMDFMIDILTVLAERHQSTLMVGRSQLQQAIPITFGYKVAGWLAPIVRHKSRLKQIKNRLSQVQFGGAVGTMASLGEIGFLVREKLAAKLNLKSPVLVWHTQRDSIAELMSFIGLLTGSISKIAQDILLMTQSEISELIEKSEGKSSTMPNKRNPIGIQKVLVAGKLARSGLPAMMESVVQDHERGSATWQMEWELIPSITSHGFYALKTLNGLLQNSIQVSETAMLKNLEISETIYAEALMMKLARHIGMQRAHNLVDYAVSKVEQYKSFKDNVLVSMEITDILSKEEIEDVFSGKIHLEMAKKSTNKLLDNIH